MAAIFACGMLSRPVLPGGMHVLRQAGGVRLRQGKGAMPVDSQKNSRVPFLSYSRPWVKAVGSCGYSLTDVYVNSCG